jgi:hypothetical protein
MKIQRWFLCVQTRLAQDGELGAMRAAITDLYEAGLAARYSLIVIAPGGRAGGVDRPPAPLSHRRILAETSGSPVVAGIGDGRAVALICRQSRLSERLASLRARLFQVVSGPPPRVWLERLPGDVSMAFELLDELCR